MKVSKISLLRYLESLNNINPNTARRGICGETGDALFTQKLLKNWKYSSGCYEFPISTSKCLSPEMEFLCSRGKNGHPPQIMAGCAVGH